MRKGVNQNHTPLQPRRGNWTAESNFSRIPPYKWMSISDFAFWGIWMFSQTVEYALRAVLHLADHSPPPRTTDQIAAATLVPKAYLSKVLQGLCHAWLRRRHRADEIP